MTDAEWNRWQANWTGATGPLPDIRARAVREVRLHRGSQVAFFALVVVGLAGAIPAFREVAVIGWVIVAFCAAMAAGYAVLQRGVAAERTGNPRDAIAFLERRLRMERLVAQLVRWVYAALVVASFVLLVPLAQRHSAPAVETSFIVAWLLLVLGVTFSAPWWVARRSRRHEAEIADWRRWLEQQHL